MLNFLSVYAGWGIVALRLAIGAVFIVHGWSEVRDPKGIAQAVWGGFTLAGLAHGLVEMVGGVLLITGMRVRETALVLALIMLGALYYKIVKWKSPFMAREGTGWEFDLVVLAGCLALLLR